MTSEIKRLLPPETVVPQVTDISGTVAMFSASASGSSTVGASSVSNYSFCPSAAASLHAVNTDGSINSTSLMSAAIDADGNFLFPSVIASGFAASSNNVEYVVRASGCGRIYFRPVTSLGVQNVTLASTLLGLTTEVSDGARRKLNEIPKSELESGLTDLSAPASSSLATLMTAIAASSTLNQRFLDVTGIPISKLQELPPSQITLTAPTSIAENSTNSYSVTVNHWNQSFVPAYEWVLNSSVVSTSSSFTLQTGKNSQGSASLVLRIGSRNGSNVLDTTKPIRTENITLSVSNDHPAVVPAVTLVGSYYRNTTSGALTLATGASMVNCETFSNLGLNNSTSVAPLLPADYNISCTSAPTQTVNFTLSGPDGVKTLAIWARDSAGNISATPSSVNVWLDQTPPVASFGTLSTQVRGGVAVNVPFTLSDASSGLNTAVLQLSLNGGTSFTDVTSLIGVTSPYSWMPPAANVTNARLRIVATDMAGNTQTLTSSDFTIDSTAPVITFLTPAANTRTQTTVAVTGSCESGLTVSFSGGVTASTAPCASSSFSTTLTLSAGDGGKTITASQTDLAGNTGSANLVVIRDTTAPSVTITGPAVNLAARNGVYLTGTCEYSASFASQNTLTLSGGLSSPATTTCQSDGTFAVSPLFTAGDGAKTITVAQTDEAGNSASASRSFIRDSAAVTLAISSPSASAEVRGTFTITGSCDDTGGASSVSISQNAGTVLSGSPVSVSCSSGLFSQSVTVTSSDGPISVRVSQTDAVAVTTDLDLALTKDTVAPSPTIAAPAANTTAQSSITLTGACENGPLITFAGSGILSSQTLSCTDGTAGITCATPSSPTCTYSQSVSLSAGEGTKAITVSQTDPAGNVGSNSRNFVRDNTAPTLSITSHTAAQTVQSAVTVAGTCEVGSGNVTIASTALASSVVVACSGGGTFSSGSITLTAPDGLKNLTASQTDPAGNVGSVAFTLTRDATPPVLTKTTPADNSSHQSAVTIVGTCESGTIVQASGTGITATPSDLCMAGAYSVGVTLTAGEGTKAITLTHADSVGNTSTLNFNLTRDNTAPTLTQTTITQNPRITNTSSITFGGACETGINVIVSGAESATRSCTAGAWTFATNRTTDGTYNYTFTQTDGAGNATAVNQQWIRDTVAPALVWSTPSANTPAQTQVTATGTCETGLNVAFSGSGILSGFSTPCSGGSFSQVLFFSSGEGTKQITLTQTDAATNSTAITRDFIRDNTPPNLTQTLRSPVSHSNLNTVTFGGACETGRTITVTGSGAASADTASLSCTASAWSYVVPTKTTDATYTYSFSQTDQAGNEAQVSAQFVRDTVAPTFTVNNDTILNAANSATFSGACETGLSINVTGAATTTVTCSAGSWSYVPTATTNGTRIYTVTQTDLAGNATTRNVTWTRDTTVPNIQLGAGQNATIKNTLNSASWSGTCQTGLNIVITGSDSQTLSCPSGTWSYTPPTQTTDGNRTYTLTQTNAIPLSASIHLTWARDTVAPVFSTSFMTLNGGASTTAFRQVQTNLRAVDATSSVSHFCLKSTTGSAPTTPVIADTCWISVAAPAVGLSPSPTLHLTSYLQNLDFQDGNYTVYAWARDEVGNISTLSNSGAGTTGQDRASITLAQGSAPVVTAIFAARVDSAYPPLLGSDEVVAAGSPVYIKWQVSDDEVLGSSAIQIFFTSDGTTWTDISGGGVSNNTQGGCTVTAPYTGCFVFTSPSNGFQRFRIQVADPGGRIAVATSNSINNSPLRIVAGSTSTGVGGDGKQTPLLEDPAATDYLQQNFVVDRRGNIYFRDFYKGIVRIRGSDGRSEVLLRKTGVSAGDGGSVASATANGIFKIAIDPQDRLLVWDANRIRRIDLSLPNPTIERIIGGGTDSSTSVSDPLQLQITSITAPGANETAYSGLFTVAPNGDIYLKVERFGRAQRYTANNHLIRRYTASSGTPTLTTMSLGGVGMEGYPTQDLAGCGFGPLTLAFTPNGDLEYIQGHGVGDAGVTGTTGVCATTIGIRGVRFDPQSGQATPTHPARADNWTALGTFSYVAGRDGKIYAYSQTNSRLYRFNHDATGASAGTYTLIAGNGTRGFCSDGSAALTCALRMRSIFVDESSTVYLFDNGLIRRINADGTLLTLAGVAMGEAAAGPATLGRFTDLISLDLNTTTSPARVVATEGAPPRIYEVTVGGSIDHLAGNGELGVPSTSQSATSQPLHVRAWFTSPHPVVVPGTEDLWMLSASNNSLRLHRLIRATGLWTVVGFNGSTSYESGDGSLITSLSSVPLSPRSNLYTPRILGVSADKLLITFYDHQSPTSSRSSALKLYDFSDSLRQSNLSAWSGTGDPPLCADGTTTATCSTNFGHNPPRAWYDSTANRWYAMTTAPNTVVAILTPGGTKQSVTLDHQARSFVHRRVGGDEYLYYCRVTDGRIYKKHIGGGTTALDWTVPGLTCSGMGMVIDEARGVIIFPFLQDGFSGIAEHSGL